VHVSRIGHGPLSYLEIQFRVIHISTRAQFIYRREIEGPRTLNYTGRFVLPFRC